MNFCMNYIMNFSVNFSMNLSMNLAQTRRPRSCPAITLEMAGCPPTPRLELAQPSLGQSARHAAGRHDLGCAAVSVHRRIFDEVLGPITAYGAKAGKAARAMQQATLDAALARRAASNSE